MVIDWRTQIEECIRFTKVIPTFHASILEQKYQQALITKKLLSMNYDATQILNWFTLAEEDCTKDMWDIEELIKIAEYKKWPKKHEFRIYITQNEIDYIKNLDAKKEFKSFLLATVAFCKMIKIKKGRATFNTRERSYIYYLATGKDEYTIGSKRGAYVQKFINQLQKDKIIRLSVKDTKYRFYRMGHRGGTVKNITNIIFNATWIEWDSKEGHEIVSLEKQINYLCNQCFEDDKAICSNCGKEFLVTNQTKRDLCLECYNKKILVEQKERMNEKNKPLLKNTRWSLEEDERLKRLYARSKGKKLSSMIKKEFPERELRTVYYRATYLNIKKP
ncbi:MAG: hypothetical protein J6T10_05350 [Methanobrevibacter sp.]|nr:hypothetical protein [Methanobrevibacter sp.]